MPFLIGNAKEVIGIADLLWTIVDENEHVSNFIFVLDKHGGKTSVDAG